MEGERDMTQTCKEKMKQAVVAFRLPRYEEIPAVGLYLEQVTRYISGYLAPLQRDSITNSMIANYVKKHMIVSPVKKQYSRDQIAYLIFIAVAKNILSLDHIKTFIVLQQQTYTPQKAYNYFCDELENVLGYVFGVHSQLVAVGKNSTDEKIMLRDAIIAVSHKLYLEKCFEVMAEEEEKSRSIGL